MGLPLNVHAERAGRIFDSTPLHLKENKQRWHPKRSLDLLRTSPLVALLPSSQKPLPPPSSVSNFWFRTRRSWSSRASLTDLTRESLTALPEPSRTRVLFPSGVEILPTASVISQPRLLTSPSKIRSRHSSNPAKMKAMLANS